MRFHFTTLLSLLSTFILFANLSIAAPITKAEADQSPKSVPVGSTRLARSIPELIAEKKAKEARALAAIDMDKEKQVQMGLW